MASEIKDIIFRHDALLLVEYDDGTFGIERDGTPLPGCRWDAKRLSVGVRTFRDIELRLHEEGSKFCGTP